MRLVLALVLVLASAGAARADVAWEAPADCPSPAAFVERLITNLGRPLRAGEADAHLAVSRHGRRWRVAMTMHTAAGEGERDLEAASCRELADSAALILALAIDPMAGTGAPAAPPAPPPPPPPAVAAADSPADDAPAVPDLARLHVDTSDDDHTPLPIAVRVRLMVGGDLGSLPGAASGVAGAAELGFGPWSIDAGVAHFTEQRAVSPDMPNEGAIVGLTSIDARGCYGDGHGPWHGGGCLGADLALDRSQGFGFDQNKPSHSVGGGAQVLASLSLRVVGPVALRADLLATWQIVRTVLVATDGSVIHDPNILAWRGFVGVEASWR